MEAVSGTPNAIQSYEIECQDSLIPLADDVYAPVTNPAPERATKPHTELMAWNVRCRTSVNGQIFAHTIENRSHTLR